jgi:hypothetical protein
LENGGFNQNAHHKDYVSSAEIQRYELEIKDLKAMMSSKDKKYNSLQTQMDSVQDQLSQN